MRRQVWREDGVQLKVEKSTGEVFVLERDAAEDVFAEERLRLARSRRSFEVGIVGKVGSVCKRAGSVFWKCLEMFGSVIFCEWCESRRERVFAAT